MKKIEAFDSFKTVNESKITNEELMDFVRKLGYDSLDDIKKEKSKLAKLEALFNELNMPDGKKAQPVQEETSDTGSDASSADGSDTGSATGDSTSSTGSDAGSATGDTTSSTGSDTGSDTDSDNGSADGSDTGAATTDTTSSDDLPATTENKPKSMHIKSFAEFCGEIEEDKESKINSDTMNESEIKTDEQFKEYAMNILKKAHPDDFDEEIANKTIEDILNDHNGDYGAAIGALNHGLSK